MPVMKIDETEKVKDRLNELKSTDIVLTGILRENAVKLCDLYKTFAETSKLDLLGVTWHKAKTAVILQWNKLDKTEKNWVKDKLGELPTNTFASNMLTFLNKQNGMQNAAEKAKPKFGEAAAAEIPGMVEAPAIPDIIKVEKGITTFGAKDYIRITYNDASGKEKRLDLYGIDLKSWASDSSEVAKALGKIEDNDLRYDYTKFSKETLNVLISEGKIKLDTKTGVLSKA